jgi:V/A-type H+-transporting ATPase subunit B
VSRQGLTAHGVDALRGPLVFLEASRTAAFHEVVDVELADGTSRPGRVVAILERATIVEVFGSTLGLDLPRATIRFRGGPLRLGVGPELLGRVFDSFGAPRDGLPPPAPLEMRAIEGAPINPTRREYPRDFLETGLSAIDGLNTVALGQKLPIFTEAGLPHDDLARQIIAQARTPGVERFAVVFVGLGLPRHVAHDYEISLRRSRGLRYTAAFLNLADDSAAERLIAPRVALTAAEYLAFDRGMHVLVVLSDMTNYGEALREVASARGEVPSRKGYPGYLYSDLASIFERAGRIKGRSGSVTQIPIVTLPGGDIAHPIPDLTGYVTEGQIVLDRELARRGVYPPVAILPSLSRLMKDAIGERRTRADHPEVARLLYTGCAGAARARSLQSVLGRDELSASERAHVTFGELLERQFVTQGRSERRTIDQTLNRGWDIAAALPESDLRTVSPAWRDRLKAPV